jgi:hypothetical protein
MPPVIQAAGAIENPRSFGRSDTHLNSLDIASHRIASHRIEMVIT